MFEVALYRFQGFLVVSKPYACSHALQLPESFSRIYCPVRRISSLPHRIRNRFHLYVDDGSPATSFIPSHFFSRAFNACSFRQLLIRFCSHFSAPNRRQGTYIKTQLYSYLDRLHLTLHAPLYPAPSHEHIERVVIGMAPRHKTDRLSPFPCSPSTILSARKSIQKNEQTLSSHATIAALLSDSLPARFHRQKLAPSSSPAIRHLHVAYLYH